MSIYPKVSKYSQVDPSLEAFETQLRLRFDNALRHYFPSQEIQPEEDSSRLVAAMHYSLHAGGKRIRPLLAYGSALAINPIIDLETIDSIACALECLHTYSLVHDDLPAMDNDELRRGKPTCHIAFDEATAILAGDGLQTLAFSLIVQTPLSAQIRIELVRQLAKASGAEGMVLGQAIDLAAVGKQLSLQQLQQMHSYKTGALIQASVSMGATAAEATQSQLSALNEYASAIGLAFQIRDDVLDVTSDTATLGKTQGSDIARNKPTYVSLLGLDGANLKTKELWQQSMDALAIFDESAAPLRQIAGHIINRSR